MIEKAIHKRIISYALLLSIFALASCEVPVTFNRDNINDAGSMSFIPKNEGLQKVEYVVVDRNEIGLTWPQIYGVTRYEIHRREINHSEFQLIHTIEDYRDTTWTDQVPKAANYKYRVDAVAHNDSSLYLERGLALSSFVVGPELQFDVSSW